MIVMKTLKNIIRQVNWKSPLKSLAICYAFSIVIVILAALPMIMVTMMMYTHYHSGNFVFLTIKSLFSPLTLLQFAIAAIIPTYILVSIYCLLIIYLSKTNLLIKILIIVIFSLLLSEFFWKLLPHVESLLNFAKTWD